MDVITTPLSSFSYRTWTTPQPRAVMVLLHGFGEHSKHFSRFARRMNDAQIDVWAIDHLGHGESPGERGRFDSLDALTDNAAALVDAVAASNEGVPVVYAGHSLGGLVACLLAQRRPPHALVVTGAPFDGPPPDLPATLVMSEDRDYLDALRDDPLGFDTTPAEPGLWSAINQAAPQVAAAVGAITAPTLLIYGRDDCFTSPPQARSWGARFGNAELKFFDGYHDIVNDRVHEALADSVISFIVNTPALQPSATPSLPITSATPTQGARS